jgi:hypothetical protein
MAKEFIVYSATKEAFQAEVEAGTVDTSQIGVIADTAEVWINKQYLPFAMPRNAHSTTPRLQQYALRASTDGSVVTDVIASVNKIIGKTVTWNQMFDTVASKTVNNITVSFDSSSNEVVLTNNSRTSNLTATTIFGRIGSQTLIAGHKYLITSTHPYAGLGITLNGSTSYYYPVNSVFTARSSWYVQVALTSSLSIAGDAAVTVLPSGKTRRIRMALYDLTEMFGAGNEPSSYGEFYELYPEPYYAPSPSTIVGTRILSIDTPVYNLWNVNKAIPGIYHYLTGEFKETVYHQKWVSTIVPVLPDMAYYLVDVANRSECMPCVFFDKDMKYIGYGGPQSLDVTLHNLSGEIVTPANAAYMAVMVYKSSLQDFSKTACVSVSSRRNGDTEPYTEQKIDLDLEDIRTVFPYGLLSIVENGVVYEDELGEGYALKYVDYDKNDDGSISNLRRMKIKNSSGVEEYKPVYYKVNERLRMTWRVKRGATEKISLASVSAPFKAYISYTLDANDLLARPMEQNSSGGNLLAMAANGETYDTGKAISAMWNTIPGESEEFIPTSNQVRVAIENLQPTTAAPATPKVLINSSAAIILRANAVLEYPVQMSIRRYTIQTIAPSANTSNTYDDVWTLRGPVNTGTEVLFPSNYTVRWRNGQSPTFEAAGVFEMRVRKWASDGDIYLAEWDVYYV